MVRASPSPPAPKPVRQARYLSRVAASASPTGADAEPVDTDVNALRAWREQCPALGALWDESKPVTAWQGLTFGEAGGANAGRVVKIELMEKRLTGDMPAELGRLTALTVLWLGSNQLKSVPAELGRLTALTTLSLGGNQLTSVPAEFGRLTARTVLWLGGNQLTSVPAELGGLTSLTALSLKGNQLTSVPAEWDAMVTFAAERKRWMSALPARKRANLKSSMAAVAWGEHAEEEERRLLFASAEADTTKTRAARRRALLLAHADLLTTPHRMMTTGEDEEDEDDEDDED